LCFAIYFVKKTRKNLFAIAAVSVALIGVYFLFVGRAFPVMNTEVAESRSSHGSRTLVNGSHDSSSSDRNRLRLDAELQFKGEAELAAAIREAFDQPYSDERQKKLSKLGNLLGKEVGISRAMEIVNTICGPGKDRIWLINSIATGASDPLADILVFARSLEYSDDHNACLAGLIASIHDRAGFSPDDLKKLAPFSNEEMRAIANGLAAGFRTVEELETRTGQAVDFIEANSSGTQREALITEYYSSLSLLAPQEALKNWIKTSEDLKLSYSGGWTQERLLSASLRSDPKRAIGVIEDALAGGDPASKGRLAASVLTQWYQIDTNAALKWASESDMHGTKIKSIAITPLFEQALSQGNVAVAKQWMMKMEDPEIRNQAQAKLPHPELGKQQ
jgi:hypothetical protein